MKKHLITTGIICAVILAVLSIIFFSVQNEITSVFIIGYVFLAISIIFQLLPAILYRSNFNLEFLYLPNTIVCGFYFIIQLIISIIALLSESISIKAILICETVLIGLFAIVMLTIHVSVQYIKRENSSSTYNFYEKFQKEIKLLMVRTTDDNLKKGLEQLSDDMNWGKSSNEGLHTEEKIISTLQKMQDSINNNKLLEIQQLLTELKILIKERNILCK